MRPTPFPFRISTLLVAWVLAGLPTPVSAEDSDKAGSDRVTVLRTPDGGIQPQAVIDAKGVIHLIYFKGNPFEGDLFFRRAPCAFQIRRSEIRQQFLRQALQNGVTH